MHATHQLEYPAMNYESYLAYSSACCVAKPGISQSASVLCVDVLIADHAIKTGIVFG